uniref:TF-B3 domain-containing protein n=1 Tax=Oryza rufipogon TaxID=4529 RepID=A0A0E0QXI1_ORYRU
MTPDQQRSCKSYAEVSSKHGARSGRCSLSTSLRLTAHVTSSIVHEQSSNIRYGENRKHGQRYAYHEPLPPEIVARCNGHDGKHLTLVTRNSKPVNAGKNLLNLLTYVVRFSVSSPSTLDLLILDKHGTSLAIPPSKRDLKLKSKRSTHQDSKGHPSNTDPGPSRIINRRVTKSANNKPKFADLCFCAENYFSKRYSIDHLEQLMTGRTEDIEVQILVGPSVNMVLHTSTDHRCNLKKGWTDFALSNGIKLNTVCIFHFYKTTHLGVIVDIF